MNQGFAIIVDIGKTTSRVSLWSRDGGMIERTTYSNAPVEIEGISRLDSGGIGRFILASIAQMAEKYDGLADVEYIVPVAHGAGLAAIDVQTLITQPFDYEQALPADLLAQYRSQRSGFAETGSPALPDGLNFGAQLFWMEQLYPEAMDGAQLLPWAQFWAWFLSGKAVSEVTSLGCHSDLWNPSAGDFSSLAKDSGWAEKFSPLARASDVIGHLRPKIAQNCGLSKNVKVLAGLHDSNAALLAARGFNAIAQKEASVLSTGTWFIAMRTIGKSSDQSRDLPQLAEERDCLINVDAFGAPTFSARFMGGREIQSLIELDDRRVDIAEDQEQLLGAIEALLESGSMILPTYAKGTGPFPNATNAWINRPDDWNARRAAVCLYAALVTDISLNLIGAKDRLLIEGRFAQAHCFTRALASLRPDMQIYTANAQNDVSFGALRLIDPDLSPAGELQMVEPLPQDLTVYRDIWKNLVEQQP